MKRSKAGGVAFLAVGVAFLALGSSGQRAYLPIGLAFIVIGVIFLLRRRQSGGAK